MTVQRLAYSSPGAAAGPEEARRLSRWWEEYRAGVCGIDISANPEMPFATRIESVVSGGVMVGRWAGSINRIERRAEHHARDGDDRINLVINRGTDASEARLGSRSLTVAPGSGIVFDLATPPVVETYPSGHNLVVLLMPRRQLRAALPSAEDIAGKQLSAANEALRLLVHYANGLLGDEKLSDPAVLDHARQSLVDLAVLALGTNRDNAEIARLRGLRAGRLAVVLRAIRRDYADPDISPEAVARGSGISTRYLHRLLHETGVSFSERVQELRLDRALSLLSRERGGGARRISDVAYEAGFNDLSYFNRSFRRKYGLTPTAARDHTEDPPT